MTIRTRTKSRFTFIAVMFSVLTASLVRPDFAAPALSVQFNASDPQFIQPAAFSGAAVVGSDADQWNVVSGLRRPGVQQNISLSDTAGQPTSTTLSLNYSGFFGRQLTDTRQWAFDGTRYASLMDQYLFGYPGPQVVLHNLPPGPYHLYVYASPTPDATGRVSEFFITTNGGTMMADVGPLGNATTFVKGTNYEHFLPVVGSDGTLIIGVLGVGTESPPLQTESDLNGFQLIDVPESQTGLAVISTLGLLVLRRRFRVCSR